MKRGWSLRRRESISERGPVSEKSSENDLDDISSGRSRTLQPYDSKKIPNEVLTAFVSEL